jgi:hypothetical protein
MRETHTATSANILAVTVETNCPRGGDSGHGGRTTLELRDEGSTDIRVHTIPDGVRIEFGGDSECGTLIECLRWAADALDRQVAANTSVR